MVQVGALARGGTEVNQTVTGRLPGGPVVRVAISDGKILSVLEVGEGTGAEPFLSPGFVDLQVNGYGGLDVNSPEIEPGEVAALTRRLWAEGVTSYCPTVVTKGAEATERAVAAVAQVWEQFPDEGLSIPAIHVEGPYISSEDGPRGAHPKEHARDPNYEEFASWQRAANGRIGILTLAPELKGAPEFIARVVSEGVLVAIGHSAANSEQIKAAADAGARLSTHLGNGAHAIIPRHPNYIWDQLAEDRLTASLITDTHHLPAAVVKVMIRAKGRERIVIVSDSSYPGGMPPGIYERGFGAGALELRPDGRLGTLGTPYLAGSASSIRQCIAGAASMTGLSLAEVLPMATENPAALIGRNDLGRLAPGARADLVLFRYQGELTVEETIVAGRTVYKRGA